MLASNLDPLLDHAPCGFLTFGSDGKVVSVNSTLLSLLGYDRHDVVDQHVERIMAIGTRIFYQTHWFPLLTLHGHVEEVFLMLRARDGENVGVLTYAHRREEEGKALFDCVFVRVQERAKYEHELLQAKRAAEESAAQLEAQAIELELQQNQLQQRTEEAEHFRRMADEANKAKSSFLATMSHELRTPLNAIGGYLQILGLGIPGPITDKQRDILERLEQSSRHLLHLINEVLNLSRIEAGQVDYHIEAVSVEKLVASIRPMIEPQLEKKQLAFDVNIPAGLTVQADIEKAGQVLLNLMSNAIKFTEPRGSVEVRARRDGSNVLIEVSDTGIGIAQEKLRDIFQPFVQVDSSLTRRAEGSGLGLAISRDLARGMGGDLQVASDPGKGSTFTFQLPSA